MDSSKPLKIKDYPVFVAFKPILPFYICNQGVDMASHIISEEGWGVPGSTNEMFYLLEENSYLERDLTERMVRSVGFRNLMVHGYVKIEMEEVYHIAQKDIHDLDKYLSAVFSKLGLKAKA